MYTFARTRNTLPAPATLNLNHTASPLVLPPPLTSRRAAEKLDENRCGVYYSVAAAHIFFLGQDRSLAPIFLFAVLFVHSMQMVPAQSCSPNFLGKATHYSIALLGKWISSTIYARFDLVSLE